MAGVVRSLRTGSSLLPALLLIVFLPQTAHARSSFQLKSADFANGARIPSTHEANTFGCTGRNIPLSLSWTNPPAHTRSFALTMIDTDAPSGSFVHWLVYDIPAGRHALTPGSLQGTQQGRDDAGRDGYIGPCPPAGSGVHHYHLTLYALSVRHIAGTGIDLTALRRAMRGHILSRASLIGTDQRS